MSEIPETLGVLLVFENEVDFLAIGIIGDAPGCDTYTRNGTKELRAEILKCLTFIQRKRQVGVQHL